MLQCLFSSSRGTFRQNIYSHFILTYGQLRVFMIASSQHASFLFVCFFAMWEETREIPHTHSKNSTQEGRSRVQPISLRTVRQTWKPHHTTPPPPPPQPDYQPKHSSKRCRNYSGHLFCFFFFFLSFGGNSKNETAKTIGIKRPTIEKLQNTLKEGKDALWDFLSKLNSALHFPIQSSAGALELIPAIFRH